MQVSIIIAYNKDRGWLDKCIDSAKSQIFKGEYEVILQKGDYTWGKNMNIALPMVKGEWIKILAEDDILTENSIQDLYDEAIKGYDFVCGDAENFGELEDGWEDFPVWIGRLTDLRKMLACNEIHGGTVLYKKEALFKVGGFDESLWTGEEYDMNLCLLAHSCRLGYVHKIVYRYRLHETNKSMYMTPQAKIERRKYIEEKIKKRYYKYL